MVQNLNYRIFRGHYPEIHHRIHPDGDIVFGDYFLGRDVHGDHAQVDLYHAVDKRNNEKQAGALGADALIKTDEENEAIDLNLKDKYDVVIDAAGVPSTFGLSLKAVKPGGKVLWLGLPAASLGVDLFSTVYRELQILTSIAYNPDDFINAIGLIEEGIFDFDKISIEKKPMSDIKEAFKMMESGRYTNIILENEL